MHLPAKPSLWGSAGSDCPFKSLKADSVEDGFWKLGASWRLFRVEGASDSALAQMREGRDEWKGGDREETLGTQNLYNLVWEVTHQHL